MPEHSIIIQPFDGGLNSKVAPHQGRVNESPDLQNVVFDDYGAVGTRTGNSALVSAGIASYPIDGLHSFQKNDGTRRIIAICGDVAWRMSGNTAVTIGSAQSVFTHDIPVQMATFQDHTWFSDGHANPYKYNGTEFTRWGVPTTSPIASAAVNSAGTQTGEYTYVLLGANSNLVMGDYASATTEITVANQRMYLTDIPVWPTSHGVNNKVICRNTANAKGVYWVVTQIANATTVYEDNFDDSQLTMAAPLDNGLPPNFTCFVMFMQRCFGASSTSSHPGWLWYSTVTTDSTGVGGQWQPEVFPSENHLNIQDGDGFYITAVGILANGIVVAKNDGRGNGSTYYVYMPDATPDNWTLTRLDTHGGAQAAKVMANFGNYLAWLNSNGVYDLNEIAIGAIRADALSFPIEDEIFTLAKSYLDVATAIVWKNKVWFSVPYGATQQTNNRILQYDYVRGRGKTERSKGAWSRFTDLAISDFTIHDGDLYGGSSASDGYIYKLDTTYADNGSAIDSYYKTMLIRGKKGHEKHTKHWRYAQVTVECTGNWYMALTYADDFDNEAGNIEQINLDSGSRDWGVAGSDWGEVDWGPGIQRKTVKVTFANAVSETLQLKFSTNTANQYWKVHKVEVFYNLKSIR